MAGNTTLLHTPGLPDTHASMWHHKSTCKPAHHKGGRSRSVCAPRQSEGERGAGEYGEGSMDKSYKNIICEIYSLIYINNLSIRWSIIVFKSIFEDE